MTPAEWAEIVSAGLAGYTFAGQLYKGYKGVKHHHEKAVKRRQSVLPKSLKRVMPANDNPSPSGSHTPRLIGGSRIGKVHIYHSPLKVKAPSKNMKKISYEERVNEEPITAMAIAGAIGAAGLHHVVHHTTDKLIDKAKEKVKSVWAKHRAKGKVASVRSATPSTTSAANDNAPKKAANDNAPKKQKITVQSKGVKINNERQIWTGARWIPETQLITELDPAGAYGFMNNTKDTVKTQNKNKGDKFGDAKKKVGKPDKTDDQDNKIDKEDQIKLGGVTPLIINPTMQQTQNKVGDGKDTTGNKEVQDGKARNTSIVKEMTLKKANKVIRKFYKGKSLKRKKVAKAFQTKRIENNIHLDESTKTPAYFSWLKRFKGWSTEQHANAAKFHENRANFYDRFPARPEGQKNLPKQHRQLSTWHRKLALDDYGRGTDTYFTNTSTEETINELSTNKLYKCYIPHATEATRNNSKKWWNRHKGVDRAWAKIEGQAKVNASEETLSELSKCRLQGYLKKMNRRLHAGLPDRRFDTHETGAWRAANKLIRKEARDVDDYTPGLDKKVAAEYKKERAKAASIRGQGQDRAFESLWKKYAKHGIGPYGRKEKIELDVNKSTDEAFIAEAVTCKKCKGKGCKKCGWTGKARGKLNELSHKLLTRYIKKARYQVRHGPEADSLGDKPDNRKLRHRMLGLHRAHKELTAEGIGPAVVGSMIGGYLGVKLRKKLLGGDKPNKPEKTKDTGASSFGPWGVHSQSPTGPKVAQGSSKPTSTMKRVHSVSAPASLPPPDKSVDKDAGNGLKSANRMSRQDFRNLYNKNPSLKVSAGKK